MDGNSESDEIQEEYKCFHHNNQKSQYFLPIKRQIFFENITIFKISNGDQCYKILTL